VRGVLLLAHGTPESLDQMPAYLARVRGGRAPAPELVEEMTRNYAAIGGRSPLLDLTRRQAAALEKALGDGRRVYVGMRNWHPLIEEALGEAVRDGVQSLVAIPMAPQYSTLSVGKYRDAVSAALPPDLAVHFVPSWHNHPGLLDAFAERLRAALDRGPWDEIVFTAHSLPTRVIEAGDPYASQVGETAAGVASRAGISRWSLAFQSAGRTPEPWLGPALEDHVASLARGGARRILVCCVGFVCDHTEILFDIDVQAQRAAAAAGVTLERTESLNDSPTFIAALRDIVRAARA
jgi:protoporphyrin/coproporphyrin ferrochelatase